MRRLITFTCCMIVFSIVSILAGCKFPSQSLRPTNLIISFETSSPDGRFSPRNVHAVWVEKADGTFVKTLDMWGKKRAKHLTTWAGAVGSMENEIQARTGATQKAYGIYSSKWDMKDADGNVVTDGDYIIRFELTSDNAYKNNYHRASVAFRKSETVGKIAPVDQGGYLNIVLDYSFETDN